MANQKIQNSVAFVTGANRGIGRAIAESLLEKGAAKVYAGARRTETLGELVERYGERVVPVELDVTNAAQVSAAAELANDVDLLVNNAGVAEHGEADFGDEAWIEAGKREFEVNTIGTLRVTQAFAPVLAGNGGGAVANVISVAGLTNFPLFFSYSWSKAALHSLTQGARVFLGAQGTKVHGVYPGPVDTDMAEEIPFEKESPRNVADAILAGIEAGTEEIYPDSFAEGFGEQYASSPKSSERQFAEMAASAS